MMLSLLHASRKDGAALFIDEQHCLSSGGKAEARLCLGSGLELGAALGPCHVIGAGSFLFLAYPIGFRAVLDPT